MKRFAKTAAVCLSAVMALSGCGNAEKTGAATVETVEPTEEVSTEVPSMAEETEAEEVDLPKADALDDTLKKSINAFNWKLYENADEESNLFYSPYSIASAVALADLGAKGTTKTEIESVLGIEDLQNFEEQIKLFAEKKKSGEPKITIANSIWIDKSLELSGDFNDTFELPAKFYFDGELKSVDFKNDTENAQNEINKWVADKTDDLISDYRSSADENTVADIMNAIYFYGEWQSKFSADDTYKEYFNGEKNSEEVDMMHMESAAFEYAESDGLKAIALPYSDGSIQMDIIMTADESSKLKDVWSAEKADELYKALDEENYQTFSKIALPKFQMDENFDGLKEALMAMGMKSAFGNDADFSGIADSLAISGIKHRAKVEVDEEGSKAAAVTEMMMETTAMLEPEDNKEFIVDRPFIFTIRDKESGVILFTGRINNL